VQYLHTFPEKSGQDVLADFEQQFIPALAITCPMQRERQPLAVMP
jgi:hypothetical protein